MPGDEPCSAVGMNPRDRLGRHLPPPALHIQFVEFAVRPYAEPPAELGFPREANHSDSFLNSFWTASGTELCLGLV